MRFILFFLPLISISVYSMDIKISKNIWEFTPDGVMGGKSKGSIQFLNTEGFDYISFRGNVNTDGGGFLMFRSKIDKKDLKEFSKISFLARGNDEKYYFHIKSRGQVLPWVRHLKEFKVGKDWKEYVLNIEEFVGYSNSRTFNKSINPKKIKLLGIEAYGRDHEVELDIAKIKIF